ncbi:MAG: C10 family peptidase [Candidatus Eisenbacteria bacterium]|nr:C10 family peptidase [Candidatus Eisenbacteria bacterium]
MRVATIIAMMVSLALGILAAGPIGLRAETATPFEMERVCHNWLSFMVEQNGSWAGSENPGIVDAQDIVVDGVVLARCYSIAPMGYIIVPILKEMMPIKAYSMDSHFDVHQTVGFPQLLKERLHIYTKTFSDKYGNLEAIQPLSGDIVFNPAQKERWAQCSADPALFLNTLATDGSSSRSTVGPLLSTVWHQGSPYNNLCPDGDGGRCIVGCVSTAVSQVMKYFEWPPSGIGDHSYYWPGDTSCGGSTPGETLYADFSDPYAWENMPNGCFPICGEIAQDALAELCYEVAVAFNMNFGNCGSGAYTSEAITIMPGYFLYDNSINQQYRGSYTAEAWFEMIKYEINNGRPMLYSFNSGTSGHAVVCDGWLDELGFSQYHINYGWGDEHTAWYTVDDIFGATGGERIIRNISPEPISVTLSADGLGDYPTIQEAVSDLYGGCIIELADGVYSGDGNRDIVLAGKSLTIRSQSGDPAACIIDCEGTVENPHRGLVLSMGEDSECVIENITITNGYDGSGGGGVSIDGIATPVLSGCVFSNNTSSWGGAVYVNNGANPTFNNCRFTQNSATNSGGALRIRNSDASLNYCVFDGNSTDGKGGALECRSSSPDISYCTFLQNSAVSDGGGIHLLTSSSPVITNTIIALGTAGNAVHCADTGSVPTFSCCDIFSNAGGPGAAGSWIGTNNNIALEPLFCDMAGGDFQQCADSPCASGQSPCGMQIGAYDVGCSSCGAGADVEPISLPNRLTLSPCAPNPFGTLTEITYSLPDGAGLHQMVLSIYGPSGRLVRTLINSKRSAGIYHVSWDGTDQTGKPVANGVYFYQLRWNDRSETRRVLLIK